MLTREGKGSFGAIPRAIQAKLREYQDRAEARPDPFLRYEYPRLLDESRAAVAALLAAPVDSVVFVSNATLGVNTVLRNLEWADDGRDEILHFDTIYAGCERTIDYIVDTAGGRVAARCVRLTYPCADVAVVAAFGDAVEASRRAGRRPRVCLLDVVSSNPGVRFPFEAVVAACRAEGVLSLVDGAQGIGMVHLDLPAADPDFFVSNCHKWLHVPRGCAVLYAPRRSQPLLRSTLPTSHGYVPASQPSRPQRVSPMPPNPKPPFVAAFEFVGTLDNAPYLCVKDSIQWRAEVLGGEDRILDYLHDLARRGGERAAAILGTKILENDERTLVRCAMVNVALPLAVGVGDTADDGAELTEAQLEREPGLESLPVVPHAAASAVANWMERVLIDDHNTFIIIYTYRGRFWVRLSAQVYLELDDFEWAGQMLKSVCARAAAGEYAKEA